jgi:hypothetical protein
MKLEDAITRLTRFSPPSVPELRYIETAVQKVHDRWPDVAVNVNSREREALAARLRDRVARDDWKDARISFVLAAAQAVFDQERRDRSELAQARRFLLDELKASRSKTFLSGMLSVHLESFVAKDSHTKAITSAIDAARDRMSASMRGLLEEVPELLDAAEGPGRLAARMTRMQDPFSELTRAGLRNPHGLGFMERVHEALSSLVAPELTGKARIDWYIDWIRPSGRDARTIGAEHAIEALTRPWLNVVPSDELRSYLVEALIEMYGDPRIRSGGVWAGVSPANMRVIHRWLTREDMRFFTGVVDAAQKDAMWPPRRDFWLQLFDEKRIDAAWVAFSYEATVYARDHLMREDARNADSRFGFQRARQNTSLLIMRIGNKVMVDGCHSYKTHVFDQEDPMAPKLFQEGYDCDEIMRASPESKSHSSIDNWKRWVRDMINADVGRALRTKPYTKVYRPRAPVARYSPPPRPHTPFPGRDQPTPQSQLESGLRSPTDAVLRTAATPRTGSARVNASPLPRAQITTEGPPADRTQTNLDMLIRLGAPAARALLDYFDRVADERTKNLLSPKARAGLQSIIRKNAHLPSNLRNALSHLLNSMDASELGPAGMMARATAAPGAMAARVPPPPPLPNTSEQRLALLLRHADAMEAFARERRDFSRDRALGNALEKLKSRNPDLRPAEVHQLQQLYELLRQDASRGHR